MTSYFVTAETFIDDLTAYVEGEYKRTYWRKWFCGLHDLEPYASNNLFVVGEKALLNNPTPW